jgi:hypothetical protein
MQRKLKQKTAKNEKSLKNSKSISTNEAKEHEE